MKGYLRFLVVGLILGLFLEAELKLVAGIRPATFVYTLFAYPIIISLSYLGSRLLDRIFSSRWKGDIIHYAGTAFFGLMVEWFLLGNGLGSNAFQLGMVAMWTTFCFGPRILTRSGLEGSSPYRKFWRAYVVVGFLVTAGILLVSGTAAKTVIAVVSLSATYIVWSISLLVMAWHSRYSLQVVSGSRSVDFPHNFSG
ncbi:MAG: hypothetical protein ACRBF0_01365 [Calditrichia bacterium]